MQAEQVKIEEHMQLNEQVRYGIKVQLVEELQKRARGVSFKVRAALHQQFAEEWRSLRETGRLHKAAEIAFSEESELTLLHSLAAGCINKTALQPSQAVA